MCCLQTLELGGGVEAGKLIKQKVPSYTPAL